MKADDPPLALLSYRAIPFPWCGRSPAELLIGRKLRTLLPRTTASLVYHNGITCPNLNQLTRTLKISRRSIMMMVTESVTCQIFQTTQMFGLLYRYWWTKLSQQDHWKGRCSLILHCSNTFRRVAQKQKSTQYQPSTATETQSTATNSYSPVMTRSQTGTIINSPDGLLYN